MSNSLKLRKIFASVGLVALYILLAKLLAYFFAGSLVIDFLWLASGLAFVVVNSGGYGMLPAVFFGALFGGLCGNDTHISVVIDAACHMLSIYLGVRLLNYGGGFNP
ncbi:MAG: hypothetical protein WCG50_02420, partial [Rhodoferax sp.]|uniref:hypothetical protein n=1 Tax=Rhodoferax sp. TaxID=50421 RepID=UPI0030162329